MEETGSKRGPCDLRRRSVVAWLLGSRVRIPLLHGVHLLCLLCVGR